MEISFVLDPLSIVLGVILNWVVIFFIAVGIALNKALKARKKINQVKESFNLDNFKL